jgi:hypothetical protein
MIVAAKGTIKPEKRFVDIWFFNNHGDTVLYPSLLTTVPGTVCIHNGLVHIHLPKDGVHEHFSNAHLEPGEYFIDPHGSVWAVFKTREEMVMWVFSEFSLENMKKMPLDGFNLWLATSIPDSHLK